MATKRKASKPPSILKSDQTLFTVDEVCQELRLSRATGYRYIVGYAGHPPVIPSVRIGHLLRVPRHVVEKICAGELPLQIEV
jgi:hypothetical protein